jgi:hypothetical protein
VTAGQIKCRLRGGAPASDGNADNQTEVGAEAEIEQIEREANGFRDEIDEA